MSEETLIQKEQRKKSKDPTFSNQSIGHYSGISFTRFYASITLFLKKSLSKVDNINILFIILL
jgi:hypothetical protein